MKDKISVLDIVQDTIVDGVGLRTAIYCAGCNNKCEGCHNPESWDINNGTYLPVENIYRYIMRNPLTNITFTGGDPLLQAEAFYDLAKLIKKNSRKNIWCYTGYLYEDIIKNKGCGFELLKQVDVLVDGKYIAELKDYKLRFKGSSNQRIIDVQKSLKMQETGSNKIILWEG